MFALVMLLMPGCAASGLVTERLQVADLIRDPENVGARELPLGSRSEQMRDLSTALEDAVSGPAAWSTSGSSIVIDAETLVVSATPELLAGVHEVLVDMRRFSDPLPAESGR